MIVQKGRHEFIIFIRSARGGWLSDFSLITPQVQRWKDLAGSTKFVITSDFMPFEGPDQLHLRAAHGYIELAMFEEANAELEEIVPKEAAPNGISTPAPATGLLRHRHDQRRRRSSPSPTLTAILDTLAARLPGYGNEVPCCCRMSAMSEYSMCPLAFTSLRKFS
jgi:hypothetical protein